MDTKAKLVSVIIPCYNCVQTIERTLKSLEKQSYSNIEVILVDDGSKDETAAVIEQYSSVNKLKLRYLKKDNEGVSIARNLGIERAEGEYILFLDSDDVYHFDFVRAMYTAVESTKLDTAFSLWSRDHMKIFLEEEYVPTNCVREVPQKELMSEFLYNKGKIGFCNFIYKKDIIYKLDLRFTPYRRTAEDIEFTWKYLCHCKRGAAINAKLYGYYNNPSSAVNSVFWERTDSLKSIVAVEEYLEAANCDFYKEFKNYMYSRTIWSYAKTFCRGRRKDLFDRLTNEYDVKSHMRNMKKNASDWKVRISSLLYCIHPNLFYFSVSLLYRRILC